MHKILLVDDEPIILSGIKFLIDWEAQDCQIVGTARNGQQALDAIDQLQPGIVVCDINMPVLSGLDVLKQTSASHPEIVFIMLTNYQEFDLARESLRFKAVDYLLKTQLEAEALEKSLALAIQESARRCKISKVNFVEHYIISNKATLIGENVRKIVYSKNGADLQESFHILYENGVFASYAMLEFLLDFSKVPNLDTFTSQDKRRIFEFEKDVIDKLVCNFFPNYSLLIPEPRGRKLLIFLWDLPRETLSASITKLYSKLNSASDNVTQARLSLLATDRFTGRDQLRSCFEQLEEMEDGYYLSARPFFCGKDLEEIPYETLNLSSQINRLAAEVRSKNVPHCGQLIQKIRDSLSQTNHRRGVGLSICMELYSVLSSVLSSLLSPEGGDFSYFGNTSDTLSRIKLLLTRDEILAWLDELERFLILQLEELCAAKSDIIERAQEYVIQNIDKRILLQDVADHINISPSYLSALFKKQYNQNFIDYVNMEKMKKACQLILEGKYRIYEISYMLGFENAYYFTKVFKRHIGLTPTEYQYKLKNEK